MTARPATSLWTIFRAWFDIEPHSLVLDSVPTPLRRERYDAD